MKLAATAQGDGSAGERSCWSIAELLLVQRKAT